MDRAYEGDETRALATANGHEPIVPPKKNRINPWDYDKTKYRRRNVVERLFRRLKAFRKVCTRYDKTDIMFLAFIQFAFVAIWLNQCQQALVNGAEKWATPPPQPLAGVPTDPNTLFASFAYTKKDFLKLLSESSLCPAKTGDFRVASFLFKQHGGANRPKYEHCIFVYWVCHNREGICLNVPPTN